MFENKQEITPEDQGRGEGFNLGVWYITDSSIIVCVRVCAWGQSEVKRRCLGDNGTFHLLLTESTHCPTRTQVKF